MKDFFKVVYVAGIGLLVAVIVYPALHEAGHCLAAICCGCTVSEMRLFPLAFTKCDIGSLNAYGKIFVGLSGMVFPFLFSIPRVKKFQLWLPLFVIRGICLLSFVVSGVSILMFWRGTIVQNEDVVQLLSMCEDGRPVICVFVIVMIILSAVVIAADRPIKRFLAYLECEKRFSS